MANDHHDPSRVAFRFFHPLRVRWSELDPQGIVFNPNYFVYFDLAVTEYLRAIGFVYPDAWDKEGCDMFVVQANASFRGSARFDDEIEVGARVRRIGNTSFAMEMGIYRADRLLVSGSLVYVCATRAEQTPVRVPDALVAAIDAFEKTPLERA